jgi:hypothetical protein
MGGIGLFLAGGTFSPARDVFPDRFANLPPQYLVTATPQSAQLDFLQFPNYTPAAAKLSRTIEQPTTQGALLTLGSVGGPAVNFTGSVAVVTGEADLPFCSVSIVGWCLRDYFLIILLYRETVVWSLLDRTSLPSLTQSRLFTLPSPISRRTCRRISGEILPCNYLPFRNSQWLS